jgi:hypothetical protein
VKPGSVLVVRRAVSEGFLVAWWRRSNRPPYPAYRLLWTAGFRVVSTVVGACVLRLLVVFVPRTSSTPVATWFWQTEGRSAECVILGVRSSEFILSEFNLLREEFLSAPIHSPPLWSPNRSFTPQPKPTRKQKLGKERAKGTLYTPKKWRKDTTRRQDKPKTTRETQNTLHNALTMPIKINKAL